MSRLRRLRQQHTTRVIVARALRRHRDWQWRFRIQRFALWFLMTHRGYTLRDALTTETDRAVLGLLRWARSGQPLYTVGSFVRAQVAW